MRGIWSGLSIALLLSSTIACGGDDDAPPVFSGMNDDDDGKDGGGDGSDDGGRNRLDAGTPGGNDAGSDVVAIDPRAPVVKFLAPSAAEDPNSDTLITTPIVKVECQVTRSQRAEANPVDQSTVRIEATYIADPDRPDKLTVLTSPVDAGEDNTFTGEFTLSDLPNGAIDFTCSANDTGMPAIKSQASLHTFVDLGPKVEIIEPKDGDARSLKSSVKVRFRVTEAPVTHGDKEAKPTDVALEVSGQSFDFDEDPKARGTYTASINFDDAKKFPMTPETAQITVTASNGRTPDAPTRKAVSEITLDSKGPTITVEAPRYGATVRGEVALSVKITDASGVADSVIGLINMDLYTLDDWTVAGDVYTERFDTRPFGTELTQLTIEIRAEDKVGNKSTASHLVNLDNLPPRVSLDPPLIRESYDDAGKTICSTPFDPVGDDAVNDRQSATVSSLYRMMVFEETNSSPGKIALFPAGVKPSTAVLFAQGDPSVPFLIDTDADGICDEINSDVRDNKGNDISPTQRPLMQLTPRGTAYYPAVGNSCNPGPMTEPPALLCPLPGTLMSRVIPQPIADAQVPAIYASGQTLNMGSVACEGDTWELLPIVGEGWGCLAARVEDEIGNVGVSRPLRVCFDEDLEDGVSPCDLDNPPSCVEDCTPPAEFSNSMTLSRR